MTKKSRNRRTNLRKFHSVKRKIYYVGWLHILPEDQEKIMKQWRELCYATVAKNYNT